jgi:pimeloyl-ACP methyl ester carboxylesterase
MSSGNVPSSAGRIAYTDVGSGPPVVLLHATLHDHRDFDPIVPDLARRYRTIALDWPGHGASDTPPRPGASLFADVLVEVVEGLGLPPAVFIGNSVGGFAAARLAVTHPDRVAGLVLVNAGGFLRPDPFSRAVTALLGWPPAARLLLPPLVPAYVKARTASDRAIRDRAVARAKTATGLRVATSIWRSFLDPDFDLRSRAGAIHQPTLLVWGTRDVVLPLRAGRAALAALPHAHLATLDTGHVVFSSAPEQFLALVEPFAAAALSSRSTS